MDRPHDTALENRPSSNQLLVDKSGRKPLFASANSRDGGMRDDAANQSRPATGRRYQPPIDGLTNRPRYEPPTPSSAARDGRQARPITSASRVPQPKGGSISHRKPLSMTEAYRLAEQEEDASGGDDDGEPMAGSPSPAPRTWRSRFNSQMKATEAGRELAKVTRGEARGPDAGADGRPRPSEGRYDYAGGEDVALPPLGPGIDDSPLPSPGPKDGLASPMKGFNTTASPQKSFAWDIDQDFTAGDLQVSDSPRIRVDERPFANRRAFDDNSEIDLNSPMRLNPPGSRNTKLDEIRVLERRAGDVQSLELVSPRKNTKLDEIAAREASAESQIPIPERKLSTPKNNKLAEIRQRELEGLSKRQLASLRLGEIREQNSMARSRFEDFEPQLAKESSEGRDTESKTEADVPARPKSAYEPARETRTNTNMTFPSRQKGGRELSRSLEDKNWRTTSEPVRPTMSHNRKSSTDVLRGANPSSTSAQRRTLSNTTSEKTSDSSDTKSRFAKRAARNGRKQNKDGAGDNKRLTVGFAGLKRVQSTESTNSKRSSMHSEPDPTERLEAELKLFAPTDNYSEPGSVRAQSPASESDDEKMAEATPKPKRQDPLLMPTPKVTGAYVETPATVRVEKIAPEDTKTDSLPAETVDERPTRASIGDRRRSSSWSSADRYTSSEPGAAERPLADEGSAATKKPRSRSLPRRRPPIRNTAKLPSVKDDLLELHRLHNVEDSTLDNLEEILTGQKPAPPSIAEEFKKRDDFDSADEETALEDLKRLEKHAPESPKRSTVVQKTFKEETPDADDLATYDRMSKSLQTVSLSIHDAKKGIEKLEDRFTSSQTEKSHAMAAETDMHDSHHRPAYTARPETSTMAYIQVPVPRLFYREPSFRFTLLGLIIFIASLWYAAETAMCANFCRPYYCDPSSGPCVWSFDDPTSFGTALPIKVDQWITGGYGRKRFEAIYEILDDAKEDLVDAALGRHITDIDVNMLPTPEKRRQHRRRLRNKGLVKRKSIEDASPEDREKWAAWRRARLASERAKEAREMGYAWEDEDGSIGGDVPVA